jgi:hypothetical protein
VVAEKAALTLPKPATSFDVVERVQGNATTDFGAPGVIPKLDGSAPTKAKAERYATLVEASWAVFEQVAKGAPASLRKGPRGGGRDRDKMIAHVIDAEFAYARKLGVKHKPPGSADLKAAPVKAMRADLVDALRSARTGEPPVEKGWPASYAARRVAWHVLDHAWEMEDRSSARQGATSE